jgi:hypothetical protein
MIIILCLISMIIIANNEAKYDYNLIKNNQPVNHNNGFIRRMLSSIITVASLMFLFDISPWKIITLNIMNAAIFSSVFKYKLNKLRGLNPQYISSSNHYDSIFIKMFHNPGQAQYIFEFIIISVMLILNVL